MQIRHIETAVLTETVVRKSFRTGAPALQRTLAVYAHLRRTGQEHAVPVPLLYRVVVDGAVTTLEQDSGKRVCVCVCVCARACMPTCPSAGGR